MWIVDSGKGVFEGNDLKKLVEKIANWCVNNNTYFQVERISYLFNAPLICKEIYISATGRCDFINKLDDLIDNIKREF